MSTDVSVRLAQPEDSERLASLIAAAFEEYRGKLDPESAALHETGEKIQSELESGAFALIAWRAGAALGCVIARPQQDDLYFGRLSVIRAARGQGLARMLVEAVEARAAMRGLSGVRLSVRIALPENQRVFAAMGYTEIGREAHTGYPRPTFITMRKDLGAA